MIDYNKKLTELELELATEFSSFGNMEFVEDEENITEQEFDDLEIVTIMNTDFRPISITNGMVYGVEGNESWYEGANDFYTALYRFSDFNSVRDRINFINYLRRK